jgi:signal transduction histidine kinase
MITPVFTPAVRDEGFPAAGPVIPSVAAPDVSPEAIAALVARGIATTVATEEATLPATDPRAILLAVTHDLRSPLNAMLMLIESLRSGRAGPVTPQQAQQLLLLQEAAQGMAAITNDAFDLARGVEVGVTEAGAPEVFDPLDILQGVRRLAQPLAETRRLPVRLSAPPLGRRQGHPALLQRVLFNLVTNALKYTTEGIVTVEIVGRMGDPIVRCVVADTGPGLTPTQIAALQQGAGGVARMDGSAGVGLALCRSLLHSLGTELHYEPNAPRGSRFHFLLPLPPAV